MTDVSDTGEDFYTKKQMDLMSMFENNLQKTLNAINNLKINPIMSEDNDDYEQERISSKITENPIEKTEYSGLDYQNKSADYNAPKNRSEYIQNPFNNIKGERLDTAEEDDEEERETNNEDCDDDLIAEKYIQQNLKNKNDLTEFYKEFTQKNRGSENSEENDLESSQKHENPKTDNNNSKSGKNFVTKYKINDLYNELGNDYKLTNNFFNSNQKKFPKPEITSNKQFQQQDESGNEESQDEIENEEDEDNQESKELEKSSCDKNPKLSYQDFFRQREKPTEALHEILGSSEKKKPSNRKCSDDSDYEEPFPFDGLEKAYGKDLKANGGGGGGYNELNKSNNIQHYQNQYGSHFDYLKSMKEFDGKNLGSDEDNKVKKLGDRFGDNDDGQMSEHRESKVERIIKEKFGGKGKLGVINHFEIDDFTERLDTDKKNKMRMQDLECEGNGSKYGEFDMSSVEKLEKMKERFGFNKNIIGGDNDSEEEEEEEVEEQKDKYEVMKGGYEISDSENEENLRPDHKEEEDSDKEEEEEEVNRRKNIDDDTEQYFANKYNFMNKNLSREPSKSDKQIIEDLQRENTLLKKQVKNSDDSWEQK